MSNQEQEGVAQFNLKKIVLALKGGRKTGLTKEFSRPLIEDFEKKIIEATPAPRVLKTGESSLLKVRVTLEASKPVGSRKEFELLRMKNKLPENDPKHVSDAELDLLMKQQLSAAAQRWKMQKSIGCFNQDEYNNTRQQIYELTISQTPDRRIDWIDCAFRMGVISEAEHDAALSKAMHDARLKWEAEDIIRGKQELERRCARAAIERILNEVGPERKSAIIEKSRY